MRKYLAEFLGTGLITAAVIGSGILASMLTKDSGVWLLINALSTIAVLFVSIVLFTKISGAHFNPVVSLVLFMDKKLTVKEFIAYLFAQIFGAISGAGLAHTMYEKSPISVSDLRRIEPGLFLSESLASAGLVLIAIASWQRFKVRSRATLISLWIGSAYFFTSSTAFANPAVSFGRMLSDTYVGLSPASLAFFIPAQILGGVIAFALNRFFSKEVS